jgi:hypothetical protein
MLGGVLRGGYTGRLAGCAIKKTALDLLTERRLLFFRAGSHLRRPPPMGAAFRCAE